MNLPEDVILEILSRVPVKPLIRFKSVCKSWNILVDNPVLIGKHYQNLSSKQSPEAFLVSRRDDATSRRVVSLLKNDKNDCNTMTLDQDRPTSFLNNIFAHVRLIGPCNGVICLSKYTDNIALWNPSMHSFKMLPQSQVPRPPNANILGGDLGIGFDPTTHDLKVMQILFIPSDGSPYQAEIYSSRTNTWKKCPDVVPGNIKCYNSGCSMVYKDDTFCWWAQDNIGDNKDEIILSFNTSKEMFGKTPFPSNIQALDGQRRTTRAILPLKESIALLVYNLKDLDKVFDIWVVCELGGSCEGWTRLASVGPISSVERPLGFWNDEELMFESNQGELVGYKISNGETMNFGIYGKRDRLEIVAYKESLFRVNS